MPLISTQPGDVVVIVSRWHIAAVGLLMAFVGLVAAFLILFAGYTTEAILLSVFVLVSVPFQLLIMYILWRFYWYFLMLGILMPPLLFFAALTGLIRVVGLTMTDSRGASISTAIGDSFAMAVLLAFGLALIAILIIALLLKSVIGSPFPSTPVDYDELDRPRPKRSTPRDLWKDDRPYPPPSDPYWDDK